MEKLLLAAALACQPGDRLIDLSSQIPRGARSIDFVVSLEPFYTRFYIYQPGFPDSTSTVLQQQIHGGSSHTSYRWEILCSAKPAPNEMDRPCAPEAGHRNVAYTLD